MYEFKILPETVWAVVTAAVIALSQVILATDPAVVSDWKLWAISLAGAVVRAIMGAILDVANVRS